jgi:sporulation protein YlmC with PRC-barrel domain
MRNARGRPVFDQDGNGIGKLDEIFVDPSTGEIRLLRVASEGIIGFGKAFTLIPAEAVTAVHHGRIVADVRPQRLLAAKSYLGTGQPRWDIPPKARVYTADGKKAGKVTQVLPGFLVVERGVYRSVEFYVPNDSIEIYDGDLVRLRVPFSEMRRRGWHLAPPLLAPEATARVLLTGPEPLASLNESVPT